MKSKNWYKKAVNERPPYNLGGWTKSMSAKLRRLKALNSRPKSLSLKHRYLSAGRALQALANVTKDRTTKLRAKEDANYFFRKLK